jgi:hypothetical protein
MTNYGWGSNTNLVGTGTAIGTGARNTSLMGGPSGAGYIARSYRGPNNLTDWFVASKDESHQMCKWQGGRPWVSDATLCASPVINSGLGAAGFTSSGGYPYFSSSENAGGTYWYLFFDSASSGGGGSKNSTAYVRPIRAF